MKHLTVSDGSPSPAERMCWSLVSVQFLVVLVLGILSGFTVSPARVCPCKPTTLCHPLPADHQYQVEVVIFDNKGPEWIHYDWSKITTIVITHSLPTALLCHAHANGIRIVMQAKVYKKYLIHVKERKRWIEGILRLVKLQFLDGLHMVPLEYISNFQALPQLLAQVKQHLQNETSGSQISVSVPWSPVCPDGKCYDYTSMAQSCDFLYVKAYDMQLEMWEECFAKANAPYDQAFSGLHYYIQLGVDPKKLILGLPWYGYDYPCEHFYEPGRCRLKASPFKGAPCSSQIANVTKYKEIMQMLPRSITGRYWDDNYKSPYFVYKDKDVYHEVWYDDPDSLSLKSSIVKKLKLGGIGAQFGNNLNYSTHPTAAIQTEDMWNALCPIRLKWRT